MKTEIYTTLLAELNGLKRQIEGDLELAKADQAWLDRPDWQDSWTIKKLEAELEIIYQSLDIVRDKRHIARHKKI